MIPIRDSVPSRRLAVVTWGLIGLNVLVFVFELSLSPAQLEWVFYWFGVVPARYSHPDWARWVGFSMDDYWPFITSLFLHGGWAHLLGNMWTLWIFGDNVEERMGGIRFALFYLTCGVAAGVVHWLVNADATVPTVGASGAIAGVMGAYFALFPFARLVVLIPVLFFPLFVVIPAATYLVFWLALQLLSGTWGVLSTTQALGGVAWWAHVGGFGTGLLLYRLFLLPKPRSRRPLEADEFGIERAWRWD